MSEKLAKLETETREKQRKEAEEKEAFHKEVRNQLANAFATHMDKFTAEQHKEWQGMKAALEGNRSDHSIQPRDHRPAPPSFTRSRASTMECFYCYEPGHFISACSKVEEDVKNGIIRRNGGRIQFYDGMNVPKEPPNRSPRDKAHEYFNRRTVSQNYEEIMDQYFGGDDSSKPDSRPSSPEGDGESIRLILTNVERLARAYETRSKGSKGNQGGFQ
ncbi:hypothetical protein C8R46DRAFT_1035124 [Mycena filopes]|nr:hypothetical protein C8R46DRAFT_1035124 [Mycena filopes]